MTEPAASTAATISSAVDPTADPIDAAAPHHADAPVALAPVEATERYASLDVLRGFALFGIFLMNIESFNRPLRSLFSDPLGASTGADRIASWCVWIFVDGRFWTLFSLLFGAGFALMLSRGSKRPGFLAMYLRRTGSLALIGAIHGTLIWNGDILFTYAIAAFLLVVALFARLWQAVVLVVLLAASTLLAKGLASYFLPLMLTLLAYLYLRSGKSLGSKRVSYATLVLGVVGVVAIGVGIAGLLHGRNEAVFPVCIGCGALIFALLTWRYGEPVERRPFVLGACWYVLPLTSVVVAMAIGSTMPPPPADEDTAKSEQEFKADVEKGHARVAEEARVMSSGSYIEALRYRAPAFGRSLVNDGGSIGAFLATFLVGLWFVRSGVLLEPARHRAVLKRLVVIGLPLGLAMSVGGFWLPMANTETMNDHLFDLQFILHLAGGMPLTLSYVAVILLALQTSLGERVLGLLAPVGRMALTNYLSQSVVSALFFYGYGLGHYGWPRLWQVGFVLVVYALQVVASRWWLAHFRFGPMEWVWRTLSYGRRQPFRLAAAPVTASALG